MMANQGIESQERRVNRAGIFFDPGAIGCIVSACHHGFGPFPRFFIFRIHHIKKGERDNEQLPRKESCRQRMVLSSQGCR